MISSTILTEEQEEAVDTFPEIILEEPMLNYNMDDYHFTELIVEGTTLNYNMDDYHFTELTVDPEKPWNWNGISQNQNITIEMIENHPEKPWDWNIISSNPILTMEFIEKHPEKAWNWEGIEENTLNVLHYDDYDDNINEYDDEGYNSEDNY